MKTKTYSTIPPVEEVKEQGCVKVRQGVFSFFKSPAQTVLPDRSVSVGQIYEHITLDMTTLKHTLELRSIIKEVEMGLRDRKEIAMYKASHFDFVTFSGVFSYRRDDDLLYHSGLMCLDFDHLGVKSILWRVREQLLNDRYFKTWLLLTSPSGDGLKWVVSIDLAKCDHRTWFRALQQYIKRTYGLEVDEKCSNVSRTCFLPHDSSCYVAPEILGMHGVCPF